MGKSSGGIRNQRKPATNPEVEWRVSQTQKEFDQMTTTQRTTALATLKKQYSERKKSIEIFGNDNAEDTLLKATKLFFKRNKLKL